MTGVGGTYLCTNPVTGAGVDNTDPPVNCQNQPNREIGWIDSGGGFSHVFAKPSYQNTLPAGSTAIGSMRGVPDVGYQASSRTGVLVYDTAPGDADSGLICPAVTRAAPAGTWSAARPQSARSGPGWSRSPTRSPGTASG